MADRVSLSELHQALLTAPSATAVLENLSGGRASIHRVSPDRRELPTSQLRDSLALAHDDEIIHRHIELRLDGTAYSDANLWYVPHRLPDEMREALAMSTVPFGHIVRPLKPSRHIIATAFGTPETAHALRHQAVLRVGDLPVALVIEQYRWSAITTP